MVQRGHKVICGAPEKDNDVISELARIGVDFYVIPLERAGMNPFADLFNCIKLEKTIKSISPDLVLAYTHKPIVYGSIASHFAKVSSFYGMVTGVGFAFTKGAGIKKKIAQFMGRSLYRFSSQYMRGVIFQNPDDMRLFQEEQLLSKKTKVTRVYGSGVEVDYYQAAPLPNKLRFLMVGRLLREKGLLEYINSAKRLSDLGKFSLIGGFDKNPTGISQKEILQLSEDDSFSYEGEFSDIREGLKQCSVFVLPSYSEGTPRSVLEAMATGRAIITTNVPGCRETIFFEETCEIWNGMTFEKMEKLGRFDPRDYQDIILKGDNGFLVPVKDVNSLCVVMKWYSENPQWVHIHGKKSRCLAEKYYDVKLVNNDIIRFIGLK